MTHHFEFKHRLYSTICSTCSMPINNMQKFQKCVNCRLTLHTKCQPRDGCDEVNLKIRTLEAPATLTKALKRVGWIIRLAEWTGKVRRLEESKLSISVLCGVWLLCQHPMIFIWIPFIVVYTQSKKKEIASPKKRQSLALVTKACDWFTKVVDLVEDCRIKFELLEQEKKQKCTTILFFICLFISATICILGWPNFLFLCISVILTSGTRLWKDLAKEIVCFFLDEPIKVGRRDCMEAFENQRWWPGLGWSDRLLRFERSAWSDNGGFQALLVEGEEWIASGGWHLCSTFWIEGRGVLLTRKRKWVRCAPALPPRN